MQQTQKIIGVKYDALSIREKEKIYSNKYFEWFKDHVSDHIFLHDTIY